jgi:hypothetical protein
VERAGVDLEGQRGEIRLPADRRDQRSDQVRDQCGDDRAERDADDDGDREVDQIAAEQELLEATHDPSRTALGPCEPGLRRPEYRDARNVIDAGRRVR